ncbi:MAG: hydrogenase formation protein HypD [Pseudomonadales bacterium]|jgi:hydrogenase expression/formation protein HypD|nr:hydrogenase formation protein HypD [Pseudomonadales bacterium]
MKFVDEFRDPDHARSLYRALDVALRRLPERDGAPLRIMEFCGGHTHTLFRYGIEQTLADRIEFVHGPGCPVCVLPMGRVDDCVSLALRPDVILATFGDAMRVPGSRMSLLQARAAGADVRMVYSPLDALALARAHPDREVVLFALGFETTMPSTALTVLEAEREGIGNFSLLCNHITTVPTLRAILDSPEMGLDGFIAPGHVSMVLGTRPFEFVARDYGKPIVITGFEPLDLLQALWMLVGQLVEGRCAVENQYARVVSECGNAAALDAMLRVFEGRDIFEWRGLGAIDHSGVGMRAAYADFDAERRFTLPRLEVADPSACQCGDVLRGALQPWQCRAFGRACTPETPLGALMVSSEGACAACYQHGDVPALIARGQRTHRRAEETAS